MARRDYSALHPKSTNRAGWGRLQGDHGLSLMNHLITHDMEYTHLDRLASSLESLLEPLLHDPLNRLSFAEAIPMALGRCNESVYDNPMVAEAYAHVHLLERYRRMWQVLCILLEAKVLPMCRRNWSVMDIGTGPAPILFAVDDFYSDIALWACEMSLVELKIAVPRLDYTEVSTSMRDFLHRLCEIGSRRGPFHLGSFTDFHDFDPAGRREQERLREDVAGFPANAYEYQLVVLSNFLTEAATVEKYGRQLQAALRNLRPGGVMVVMGGTQGPYPEIYARIGRIARNGGVRDISHLVPSIVPCRLGDRASARIKQHYSWVWSRMSDVPQRLKDLIPPDLWNPETEYSNTRHFALHLFRKGRLPGRLSQRDGQQLGS